MQQRLHSHRFQFHENKNIYTSNSRLFASLHGHTDSPRASGGCLCTNDAYYDFKNKPADYMGSQAGTHAQQLFMV